MNKIKYFNNQPQMHKVLTLVILLCLPMWILAQRPISIDKAVQIAIKNNHNIKSQKIKVDYQTALEKSYKQLPATNFSAELGQFNSTYFDTKFGVAQAFNMPTVSKRRQEVLRQETKLAMLEGVLSEVALKKQIDLIFNQYYFLVRKEKLMIESNTFFEALYQRAISRFNNGETDILEKTSIESQKNNVNQLLNIVRQDLKLTLMELNFIINDGNEYMPLSDDLQLLRYNVFSDSALVSRHPYLMLAKHEVSLSKSKTQVQKSALLPEISVGYNNFSIRGTGADNNTYNAGDRFSSVQLGVNVPIFRKSIHAVIQASQIEESMKSAQVEMMSAALKNQLRTEFISYQQALTQIDLLESSGLNNAKIIKQTALQQLNSGQINYLEFVMLINQSIDIENQYALAIKTANDHIINLFYLNNNQ